MTAPVWFHLLAGPNGAGKSTLYRALRADGLVERSAEFVNADLHERDRLQHIADARQRSEAARAWADARRGELLAQGVPLVSETVFSHPSKLDLIRDAKARGYTVALQVVALDDPQRLLARVAQRVREGGHAVPPERILARYPRTLEHLRQAVPLADVAYLYDAREVGDGGPRLVALHAGGRTTWIDPPAPAWARAMLPDADSR